ncbi:hypothetical protein NTE_03083 [Candidatus Nitrososphaera evergladensis SR1]|uniref:Uncharacterized protein n=1 Tax=Candidatus Nitrososphaera evergladensis SR1 TaxID=1459636 RepID=A0A075MWU1_9ARCH|nr:hypothetical protein NTE_03083 [Candidatus Nitrososphaera evergladensis SR1]
MARMAKMERTARTETSSLYSIKTFFIIIYEHLHIPFAILKLQSKALSDQS